jgi:hypothetical protein
LASSDLSAVGGCALGFQYEFAEPSWRQRLGGLAQGEIKHLTHSVGGDINSYVVDMQFRSSGAEKVNQVFLAAGTAIRWEPLDKLTTSDLRVYSASSIATAMRSGVMDMEDRPSQF